MLVVLNRMAGILPVVLFVFLITTVLAACSDDNVSEVPPPAELTMDAIGYYCSMTVMGHDGPKGQIHLDSDKEVKWFTSVRDTLAFTRIPGEPRDISVIYVSDMTGIKDWSAPGLAAWIEADKAYFVIGSSKKGGMGAPELVPFSASEAATSFAGEFGGKVVELADVPDNILVGTSDMEMQDHQQSEIKHD